MCTCIFYSHCLCSQTSCTCQCWCMNNCSENVVWQLDHTCESALQIWRNWKVQWALGCSWLYFNQLLWIFCAIKTIVSIIPNFFCTCILMTYYIHKLWFKSGWFFFQGCHKWCHFQWMCSSWKLSKEERCMQWKTS